MSHLLTSEPGGGGCTLLLQQIDLEVFANQVLQTEGRYHCTKILSSDGFYLTFTVVEISSLIVRLFC